MKDTSKRASTIMAMIFIASIVSLPGATTTVQADGPLIAHDTIRVNNEGELAELTINGVQIEGSGTVDDPYIIENLDIDAAGTGAAIYIGNTTSHVIVRNCMLYGAVHSTSNLPYSSGSGLLLNNVRNATAENNQCSDNWEGIGLVNSSDNVIMYNDCSDNGHYGISLNYSSHNVIEDNGVNNNSDHGICVTPGSGNNSIFLNNISQNHGRGIHLAGAGVVNNSIYANMFTDNNGASSEYNPSHIQAYDGGTNIWNYSSFGNYWSDWNSPDVDKDGIVDVPYGIEGGSNEDPYPTVMTEVHITSPAHNTIVRSPTVLVTGMATPGYPLEINGLLVNVRDSGRFEVVIPLLEGSNQVNARSISPLFYSVFATSITYVNQAQEEIDDLNEELEDIRVRLSDSETLIDSTRRWLQSESDRLTTAWNAGNATADDVDSLLAEVQTMKSSLISLRASLSSADGNVSGMLEDLDDAIVELTSMEAELSEVQKEIAVTQKDVGDVKNDSLPLMLGAVGLVLGAVAIALSFFNTRKKAS